jgi:hypothetical protein
VIPVVNSVLVVFVNERVVLKIEKKVVPVVFVNETVVLNPEKNVVPVVSVNETVVVNLVVTVVVNPPPPYGPTTTDLGHEKAASPRREGGTPARTPHGSV